MKKQARDFSSYLIAKLFILENEEEKLPAGWRRREERMAALEENCRAMDALVLANRAPGFQISVNDDRSLTLSLFLESLEIGPENGELFRRFVRDALRLKIGRGEEGTVRLDLTLPGVWEIPD